MSTNRMARVGIIAGSTIAALSLAGFASATVASAADGTPSPSASQSATAHAPHARVAEEALTGATADRVKAAVLAKYPGATIDRMEKDADGGAVYEAHITKADGTRVTALLDANFVVTGEGAGRQGKGPQGDRGGKMHAAPEALTGATADRVKAAVLAKYPGATVDRMEKDFRSPTGYVAFIKKADGTRALVKVDANFAVTGEAGRGDKGPKDAKVPGAYGARGGHHGHASGSASSATRGPAA